ncbi:MAG: hypothetical protein KL787_08895 [Taibaiella sp.]|nr:hypothetical protein [Taibaiella sp.]
MADFLSHAHKKRQEIAKSIYESYNHAHIEAQNKTDDIHLSQKFPAKWQSMTKNEQLNYNRVNNISPITYNTE